MYLISRMVFLKAAFMVINSKLFDKTSLLENKTRPFWANIMVTLGLNVLMDVKVPFIYWEALVSIVWFKKFSETFCIGYNCFYVWVTIYLTSDDIWSCDFLKQVQRSLVLVYAGAQVPDLLGCLLYSSLQCCLDASWS